MDPTDQKNVGMYDVRNYVRYSNDDELCVHRNNIGQ